MRSSAIVVPCYNEEKRLAGEHFVRFATENPGVFFFFVDDGSTDGTALVLESLTQANACIDFIRLPTNQGKAEAVRQGILHMVETDATYIGYWDADLATPLATIKQMVALMDDRVQTFAVFGSRVRLLGRAIERRTLRHYLGRIFATFASWVLGLAVYDTQCGAKLFRNSSHLKQLFAMPFLSKWIFDVEIIARLKRQRQALDLSPVEECLCEYPLSAWSDIDGSKMKKGDFFRVVLDLYRIGRCLNRT